ncbi:hypothetical protein [Clostridium tyrobutyricum]|nr:hypothetical protein [Clostridium tyrobutyricum]
MAIGEKDTVVFFIAKNRETKMRQIWDKSETKLGKNLYRNDI